MGHYGRVNELLHYIIKPSAVTHMNNPQRLYLAASTDDLRDKSRMKKIVQADFTILIRINCKTYSRPDNDYVTATDCRFDLIMNKDSCTGFNGYNIPMERT